MRKRIAALFLALVLCVGLCLPASAAGGFTDVLDDSPYAAAIEEAVAIGIAKGTTATTFSPNNPCTVSHILTFLVRSMGEAPPPAEEEKQYVYEFAVMLQDFGCPIIPENLNVPCSRLLAVRIIYAFDVLIYGANLNLDLAAARVFTDLPSDGASQNAIAFALQCGITTGTTATTFSPDTTCTRGQIITFIFRNGAAINSDLF